MKWWYWLILELMIMFGVIAWIYFFPSELWEEDCCRALLAYVIIFCIEKIRKYFREEGMAYKRADFKLDETNDIDKRIKEAAKMFRERGLNATVWYDQDECVYKCSDQTGLWKSIDGVKWDKIEGEQNGKNCKKSNI